MRITKIAFAFVLSCFVFIGCKDTATTEVKGKKNAATAKIIAAAKPAKVSVNIEGMTCAMGCAKAIENQLIHLNGVQNATVNFEEKMAVINFDSAILSSTEILKTIESAADGKTYKTKEIKKG